MSNKVKSSERIKLAKEDDTLTTNEEEVTMKLKDFYSNVVINFKIRKFENFDSFSGNTDHPTLKATVKYKKHPSIISITSEFTNECFSFHTITI